MQCLQRVCLTVGSLQLIHATSHSTMLSSAVGVAVAGDGGFGGQPAMKRQNICYCAPAVPTNCVQCAWNQSGMAWCCSVCTCGHHVYFDYNSCCNLSFSLPQSSAVVFGEGNSCNSSTLHCTPCQCCSANKHRVPDVLSFLARRVLLFD